MFDANRDGKIDFRELVAGLSGIRDQAGEERIQLCFKIYDMDDSGFISREELGSMLAAVSMGADESNEGNQGNEGGGVAHGGVGAGPSVGVGDGVGVGAGAGAGSVLGAERLGDLFERLDANNDGLISYDEFRKGIVKDRYLIDVFFGGPNAK